MTKEELKDQMLEAWVQTDSVQECINLAIEYADQQTLELKAELNEVKKQYSELCDIQKKLCEQNINLESELNELKKRHKRDVEEAFQHGCEFSDDGIYYMGKKSYFIGKSEQYYKQKFESND